MSQKKLYPKMNREDRAKQFMPFAALKGYEEALRQKEKIIIPRSELSEEKLSELDDIFKELSLGKIISCIHYDSREGLYLKTTGMISKIDTSSRILKIVNTKINFDDIYEISF